MNPMLKTGFHVYCEILTEHLHKVCGFVNHHNVPYATRDEAQTLIDALHLKVLDLNYLVIWDTDEVLIPSKTLKSMISMRLKIEEVQSPTDDAYDPDDGIPDLPIGTQLTMPNGKTVEVTKCHSRFTCIGNCELQIYEHLCSSSRCDAGRRKDRTEVYFKEVK